MKLKINSKILNFIYLLSSALVKTFLPPNVDPIEINYSLAEDEYSQSRKSEIIS